MQIANPLATRRNNKESRSQMKIVKAEQLQEVEPFSFIAEASSLGFAMGEWPKSLATNVGNQAPFILTELTEEKAKYVQCFGCVRLTVFND